MVSVILNLPIHTSLLEIHFYFNTEQWYKDIEDLQMRMTALETTVAGINAGGNVDPATVAQLQTDLTALTAKEAALCAKVHKIS